MTLPSAPPEAVAQWPTCVVGLRTAAEGTLQEILFLPPGTPTKSELSPAGKILRDWLDAWLEAPATPLALALQSRGTQFQQRVWAAIRAIPPGQTRSYGELAALLGSAPRAVGQACGNNPFPLLTPCHRVRARTGTGGFAHAESGWLISTKLWLLAHEARYAPFF
ncbi:MAG: methylated-DNA--[protein]-cysteine S-methyltransferase [Candidatus Dactylopiibacterium sp.]|nr:methylated-DNA--[protein]-cysteine S-methyltransferase [Candidatus Dactylopiibacterium sp.]